MADGSSGTLNRYQRLIEHIFLANYTPGARIVEFSRDDFDAAADTLGIKRIKNLGDIVYSFRYRGTLPDSVRAKAPEGEDWIIRPAGRSLYTFVATKVVTIVPTALLAETKVPDATPGLITMYATDDEQALLAKLRYNRLIDVFTGVTCYSLQNHLRTAVPNLGQVETDEIYVGIDRRGAHYVVPVQAKGGSDRLGIVQIEQDFALCAHRFPTLICRPVAAQFMDDTLIALFEFEEGNAGIALSAERHYRLVPPDSMTTTDLESYRARSLA